MVDSAPICFKCHKPPYPEELTNTDRNTWCSCHRIGVPDGWSGYVDHGPKRFKQKRRWK